MDDLLQSLRNFRDARDWAQFHTPKDLAISVALEAAELLQIFQWHDQGEPLSESQRRAISEEAADVLVYLLYLCDKIGVDLAAVTHEKIAGNEARYPVHLSRGVATRPPSKGKMK